MDFNGDGRSDVLWLMGDNLAVSNWLGTAAGGFANNDANAFSWLTAWDTYQYLAAGDFNGDGRTDLIWLVDNEVFASWFADDKGGFRVGQADSFFEMKDPNWQIAGVGDFNGDHIDDLLWRNKDGTLSDWLGTSSGKFVVNDANAMVHVSNEWSVAGTGDFDGDGRTDILWRSDEGMLSNWLGRSDGGFVVNDANALTNLGRDAGPFEVLGVGDFNGDRQDDVLFRVAADQVFVLQSDDGAFYPQWSAGLVAQVPQAWDVAGVGDYNGDGTDDILWRNQNGVVSDWLGTHGNPYEFHINDAVAMVGVSNDWQIAGLF